MGAWLVGGGGILGLSFYEGDTEAFRLAVVAVSDEGKTTFGVDLTWYIRCTLVQLKSRC